MTSARQRYAIVGAGARAEMFVRSLVVEQADRAELVAFADTNPLRIRAHNQWLGELGQATGGRVRGRGLRRDAVQGAGRRRDRHVGRRHPRAVHRGCAGGRAGRDHREADDRRRGELHPDPPDGPARGRLGGRGVQLPLQPVHERVREVLAGGEIGEIGSVHFEWLLDVRHGADYFRRWHRDRANSGGLRELYLDAEGQDGYLRDQNVFADGVSIDDDMSVLVRYDTGATMTYHLTAYSPWEGYRLMVDGSRGRLELEVVENDFVDPALAQGNQGRRRGGRPHRPRPAAGLTTAV